MCVRFKPLSLPSLTAGLLALLWTGCSAQGPGDSEGRLAPLLQNIGELHCPITTTNPMAQRFFDQGMSLLYGFNHQEAVRSFQEAARLDPDSAMCFWGQALAHGPNINDPSPDQEREKKARAAIEKALAMKAKASLREQALVDALATRYSASEEVDREALNKAYAEAMAKVQKQFADDPEAAVLYAAAVMNTTPWDYWSEGGQPKPGTEDLVPLLESAMQRHPDHPGAHHYYIHLVEASPDPDRAITSADRLGDLVPVAGHLVHMPSHIYIRVGRYADATSANLRAIAADEDYVSQCRAQGMYPVTYYPHNIHFLWAALTMEGRADEAIRQARQVASKHEKAHFHMQGFGFPHLLRAVPFFALTRFAKWEQILAEPEPTQDLVFVRGIRHFARGMAFRAMGQLKEARGELDQLKALTGEPILKELKIWDANSLERLLTIASELLSGELAAKQGKVGQAIAHLRKAAEIEDQLKYSEPRDWPQPVRHSLGAVLLEAGRSAEAEEIYRQDLEQHRNNGWALYGLWKSLEAQGKSRAAGKVKQQFETAWKHADIVLTASRL